MPTKNITEDKGVNLLIIRDTFTDKSTIGKLYINGELVDSISSFPNSLNSYAYGFVVGGRTLSSNGFSLPASSSLKYCSSNIPNALTTAVKLNGSNSPSRFW